MDLDFFLSAHLVVVISKPYLKTSFYCSVIRLPYHSPVVLCGFCPLFHLLSNPSLHKDCGLALLFKVYLALLITCQKMR